MTRIFTAWSDGRFTHAGGEDRCALGRSGVIEAGDKREGDGFSPLGAWPLRRVFFRPDRGPPPGTALATRAISPKDGWCDDPADPAYNRLIQKPYPASHEDLWRADGVYDLIVELGHNDDPPIPGLGSAIFLHLARPGFTPTEGCVALERAALEAVLRQAEPGAVLEIRRAG